MPSAKPDKGLDLMNCENCEIMTKSSQEFNRMRHPGT